MSDDDKLDAALNLMRRMPPSSTENTLAGLIEMVPELTDDLLTQVDQPLKVEKDPKTGKMFVLCDYNRDGDSYRSPWSNEYFPAVDDGFLPSKRLREMEIGANNLFDVYRKMYFDTGYSSAYFFDTDENDDKTFGACFLIHKDVDEAGSNLKGWWDSIHVFEASPDQGNNFLYKLTTTLMISVVLTNDKIGAVDLSGLRTKQKTLSLPVTADQPHIVNLGGMLEDMELRLRNDIEGIYIQKTREVIDGMRKKNADNKEAEWANIAKSLNAAVFHNKDNK